MGHRRDLSRSQRPRQSRGFPATWRFRWGKTKKYGHLGFLPEFPFRAGEGSAGTDGR
jgi:hypothetical protein